ncbi:MAG: GyrI-like domain-containing protein [Thermoguttaceae bacterium]
MSFEVSIVEFSAKHLVGMKVATSMQNAQVDCQKAWETFAPRMSEVHGTVCGCGSCGCTEAFGVSVMTSENEFDYWAAVPAAPETPLPSGMGRIEIPAGLYAKCTVSGGLEKLVEAFMYIYGPWIHGQTEYCLSMQAPCFEQYPPNWQFDADFDIFAPVVKQ